MTMQFNPWMTLLVASLLASGCSGDDEHSNTPNSSKPVLATSDSGTSDSGTSDSDTPDSGTPDSDAPDSGTPDSGDLCQLVATGASSALSIAGKYTDDWGQVDQITADTWTMDTSVFRLSQVDNSLLFAIAQNDCANAYNPGDWSRFDWTYDADLALWYCQTAYAAKTADTALQTPAADAQNLETGCGGFAWSKLTPTS